MEPRRDQEFPVQSPDTLCPARCYTKVPAPQTNGPQSCEKPSAQHRACRCSSASASTAIQAVRYPCYGNSVSDQAPCFPFACHNTWRCSPPTGARPLRQTQADANRTRWPAPFARPMAPSIILVLQPLFRSPCFARGRVIAAPANDSSSNNQSESCKIYTSTNNNFQS